MAEIFPGEKAHVNSLIAVLRPTFESLWAAYGKNYA